jgi:hypothetical protein
MDRKAVKMNYDHLYELILDYQREKLTAAKQYRLARDAKRSLSAAKPNKLPLLARFGLRLVSWGNGLQARSGVYPLSRSRHTPCTD